MLISFNNRLPAISGETFSLFKNRLAFSLTDQHKKILLIVTATLSLLLAAGCIINRICCFKAKSSNLLDKISSKLSLQYQNLKSKEGVNKNSETIVLDDSTTIKIDMERKIIKGCQVYIKTRANVVITPENEQATQAVAAYFNKPIHPNEHFPDYQHLPCDTVKINDKKLILNKSMS